ncbi:hypothetical protein [Phenylobacterium sp.]|jgi:hypothetical protein|uniref:hypothetical protein n=1 Tax=Phenylobacterium sp. TaxID=1871053 RepID=UPI002F926D26
MALGCATAADAADAPLQPRPRVEVGFHGAADRLWTGSMITEQCVSPRRRRALSLLLPRQRYAVEERRGELIGEFLSPAPAPHLVATARSCAAAAGETATTPVMLGGGAAGFSRFRTAFADCMHQRQAADAVGSITLWIDNHCNW